jgi:transposase
MSIKPKRYSPIKSDIMVIGIDVAKRRHVAAIRLPDGNICRPFSFSNNRGGFQRLVDQAQAALDTSGASSVRFALEATGHYGHALQYFLLSGGWPVDGVNPAHTKKVKEVLDGSPEKSDRKDSILIADLAAQGRCRPVSAPMGVYAELRRLGKLRDQLSTERTQYLNRYTGLVDLVFPELTELVSNVNCTTIRNLLLEFPTAAAISQRQFRRIWGLLHKWSIGHFDETRCRKIYEASKSSIGVREGVDAIGLQMRLTLRSLQRLESQLAEVETTQANVLKQIPYAQHLLTIPEISTVTLATVLGETGDLSEFHSGDALIKLAGLNLYSISSGSFCGRTRISKRGRPLLRRIIFLAALRLSKEGRPLKEFHDRLAERLAKPQVAVACSRKLLRLMYAMVRDGVDYQPGLLAISGQEAA